MSEIDQQIVTIQNEFEADLDNLIDAYRSLQQQAKKKGLLVPGTVALLISHAMCIFCYALFAS